MTYFPDDKDRFYPKLSQNEIDELVYIFGVGGLNETRCFSILARPTTLSSKAKMILNITSKQPTIEDINKAMAGKKVLVVASDDDNPNLYKVKTGTFIKLGTFCYGYPYNNTYASVNIHGKIFEKVTLKRIFLSVKDIIKTIPLNPHAQAFKIP
tara:strand:+ start:97 stop:558 length:462 start_codon:yes stop_codon:yes gene_type:complete